MNADYVKVKHLFNRSGYGITMNDLKKVQELNIKQAVEFIFKDSKDVKPIELIKENLVLPYAKQIEDKEKATRYRKLNQEMVNEMNIAWFKRMASGKGVLREKMTLFWHDHFACRSQNAYYIQLQNNTLRKHALGSFRNLLHAISKDPAMLLFLDNQKNSKKSPNENFAREVLELFTLGRGNYSENDIKNAARAFTGWTADVNGVFTFNEKAHDYGDKTFLGKTGNWSGEEVLDKILEKKETALFITRKIYRYLVNEVEDEGVINKLASSFYQSDYNIEGLVKQILTAEWFYTSKNMGNRIKSPVELLVSLTGQLNLTYQNEQSIVFLQRLLGQVMFLPPNVGGWPEAREWIDSSSLTMRMQIPYKIYHASRLDFEAKDDGDVNTENIGKKNTNWFYVSLNIQPFLELLKEQKDQEMIDVYESYLLPVKVGPNNAALLKNEIQKEQSLQMKIKRLGIFMCTFPEFQLC